MKGLAILLLACGAWAKGPAAVTVGADAQDWRPVSVRSSPAAVGRTFFERKVGQGRGAPSPARAAARLHADKKGRLLIVSVYPSSLRGRRTHLEVRLSVEQGELEKASVAAVTVVGGTPSAADEKEDSVTLRAKGTDFIEESPASASLFLSSLDLGPGRAANAGRVKDASFGGMNLGMVDFSWNLSQVAPEPPSRGARRPNHS